METDVLINAYYERLYEWLAQARDELGERAQELLEQEIETRGFVVADQERLAAYHDACLAFIDERIEMYNPIGIQYTFDRANSEQARQLELQLSWHDSRAEWKRLVRVARQLAGTADLGASAQSLAVELVRRVGAFPNASIRAGYEDGPDLQKLPDYIVALTIQRHLDRRCLGPCDADGV